MISIGIVIVAALVGYLVGSISFAAIVGRFVAPQADLWRTPISLPDGPEIEMEAISATSLRMRAGPRWGVVVALLDITKAALVTLAFRLAAPDEPAYLAAAAFVVVGHIWPIWHGFKGGYGISPMLGGVGVIDPLSLLVTLPLGMLAGLLRKDMMLMVDGWTLFLVPWLVVTRADLAVIAYAVFIVLLYWARTRRVRRELKG